MNFLNQVAAFKGAEIKPDVGVKTTKSIGAGCAKTPQVKVCFHCQAPLTQFSNVLATTAGEHVSVCCHGCKSAVEFIDEQDLSDFYQAREVNRISERPNQTAGNVSQHNPEYFDGNEWGLQRDGDRCRVTLSVPAMYCGSCAWLIRKSLEDLNLRQGLGLQVLVHSETKQVSLTWQAQAEENLGLPMILAQLLKLGYSAHPQRGEQGADNAVLEAENALFLKRILIAGLGTMQVMTYAVAHYVGAEASPSIARFLELLSMLVATVVVMYSGQYFFSHAWRDIKNRHLGMDVPVALAIGSAFFLSALQTLIEWEGRVLYYDSAVMFVFFLLVGRYVEARARHHFISTADALSSSLPSSFSVSRSVGDPEHQHMSVTPKTVCEGDTIELKHGNVVPFDGVVVDGLADVDESLVTGESKPVLRGENEHLLASTRLVSGHVTVQCTRSWRDSSLASLQSLIDQGQQHGQQGDTKMAVISRYFVLAILFMTIVIGSIWAVIDPSRTFEVILAILIASCPCAFALAAPIGTTVASNVLRQRGVLLANGESLGPLAEAKLWWFDKTGTLTQGKPEIVSVTLSPDLKTVFRPDFDNKAVVKGQNIELTTDHCLDIVAALEQHSKHPLANAFACRDTALYAQELSEQLGCGVSGVIDGERYFAGKFEWVLQQITTDSVDDEANAIVQLWAKTAQSGSSRIYLASAMQVLACVELQDSPKSGLPALLECLRQKQVKTALVSGDNRTSVDAFAKHAPFDRCYSEQAPEQKLALIRSHSQTPWPNVVVGDGANDAPMLAQGDVAIAFASGSELSQAQADVVVLNRDLRALVFLQRVAQTSRRVMNQNMVWAIGYNLAILPLAALGLLTPWIAAIGMSLSSLVVVLNTARITRVR